MYIDPFKDLEQKLRKLSKPKQALIAVALTVAMLYEGLRVRQPGEPQQAFWFTLLMFAALTVLNELMRPKPKIENARPNGLGDFNFPTATEGRVLPLIWGRVKMSGPNVVWYGDLLQDPIRETVKTGLFSSTKITKGFRYRIGMQLAFCLGPSVTLKRVWIGDTEVFSGTVNTETSFDIDQPDLYGDDDLGNGGVQATCDFYPGNDSQGVNDYLNQSGRQLISVAATPTAPAYNKVCHIVVRELGVAASVARGAYLGNSTSIKAWAIEAERFPLGIPGQGAGENKINNEDSNPANVIYEAITDTDWGLGDPAADVDSATFVAAADTLIAEGNGFSFILDRPLQVLDLIREVERQIDGFTFQHPTTGKWTLKLARDDYDIDTVQQVNDDNCTVLNYTKGSWEETTNQITTKFNKRSDNYKESFGLAQDSANILMQGSGTVSTGKIVAAEIVYPGVKNKELAQQLAWRDLRTQAYPLARATFEIDRTVGIITPGSVIAWTTSQFGGFTKLPMRVINVDYGDPENNRQIVQVVQDVFKYAAASYGNPPDTGWVEPSTTLAAYPSDEQIAFEAPRAIVVRDPDFSGDTSQSKVMCAVRRQTTEIAARIKQRNSSGALSGAYENAGNVVGFMLIGELDSALSAGTAVPTSTITVVATPDTQAAILAAFDANAASTLADIGAELVNLIMVGDEFMLVTSAVANGSDVDLEDVYRGVLDSVQENHAAGTPVYLLFVGAGICSTNFPNTYNVGVELRMRSQLGTFAGVVTPITLTMDKRTLRPYPPNQIFVNGSATEFATPDLEGDGGATENDYGFDVEWWRKRFNTGDEVAECTQDNEPDASTEYRVRVFVDPLGANTEVHTSAWQTGTGPEFVNRLSILNEAAAGTTIRVSIESRHDILDEVNLVSRNALYYDTVPTTVLAGFYLGGNLAANVNSNSYTAVATGTFSVDIGEAYATSNVQVSLNGGAYSTVIAAGLTTGTFAATSGDTIRLRHTVNEVPALQYVVLRNPSSSIVAYGVFTN